MSHNLFGNAMLLFGTKDSNWNMTFKFSCRQALTFAGGFATYACAL